MGYLGGVILEAVGEMDLAGFYLIPPAWVRQRSVESSEEESREKRESGVGGEGGGEGKTRLGRWGV